MEENLLGYRELYEAIIKQACEDMVSYCGIGDDAANGLVDHILQGNIRNIIVKF